MDSLIVRGGNPLLGDVKISGAKNAALPLMAAGILCDEWIVLKNCPEISDVGHMAKALSDMGVETFAGHNTIELCGERLCETTLKEADAQQIRSSLFALGAVLARCGSADFPFPGGCRIGARPIDQHIHALKCLGAHVSEEGSRIRCRTKRLHGARIEFSCPSVGATENAMLAAVTAVGESIIIGAAREPEICELAALLRKMGAQISGEGTAAIEINGVDRLSGACHTISGDRIEAGTFLCACAAAGGRIKVTGVPPKNLMVVCETLSDAGAKLSMGSDYIEITADRRMKSFMIKTAPWPGFPTDAQPAMCAVAATADGTSIIDERVFDNRLSHVSQLARLGCYAEIYGGKAYITGSDALIGSELQGADLRGSAALVISALAAKGTSRVEGMAYLERGYERFYQKLQSLGADVSEEYDL